MGSSVATHPVIPATSTGLNHTVGIEPATDEIRTRSLRLSHARTVVVERYNGALIQVITSDNDDTRRLPLVNVAELEATLRHAEVAPPVWPVCDWCDKPDNECGDLFGHGRLRARREQTWREPLVLTADNNVAAGYAR